MVAAGFQLAQFGGGGVDGINRHAREPRHLQAVAFARRAFFDVVHEDDVVVVFDGGEVDVFDVLVGFRQFGQLEVVGGEQGQRVVLAGKAFGGGPGE